jgi:FkbM family methyltransferase
MTLKQKLIEYRRHLYELFGSGRYSRPALNDLDRKLEEYLPYRDGFFIEAGANDGFAQSNTYYFEKIRGWTGILVEPIPFLYEKCVKKRPNSTVFNCALVSKDYEGQSVKMLYSNLMSLVRGARKSEALDLEHAKRGLKQRSVKEVTEITVPARTLTSILDEVGVQEIDLFSLDVEGYELNVLRGLDLEKYRPKYMLIETDFREEIEEYLSVRGYEAVDMLSHHDVLYRGK